MLFFFSLLVSLFSSLTVVFCLNMLPFIRSLTNKNAFLNESCAISIETLLNWALLQSLIKGIRILEVTSSPVVMYHIGHLIGYFIRMVVKWVQRHVLFLLLIFFIIQILRVIVLIIVLVTHLWVISFQVLMLWRSYDGITCLLVLILSILSLLRVRSSFSLLLLNCCDLSLVAWLWILWPLWRRTWALNVLDAFKMSCSFIFKICRLSRPRLFSLDNFCSIIRLESSQVNEVCLNNMLVVHLWRRDRARSSRVKAFKLSLPHLSFVFG